MTFRANWVLRRISTGLRNFGLNNQSISSSNLLFYEIKNCFGNIIRLSSKTLLISLSSVLFARTEESFLMMIGILLNDS